MTTPRCRANVPSECRNHGTNSKLSALKEQAQEAVLADDLSTYLQIQEKMSRITDDEMPDSEKYPFLVYGTLRPSGTNYEPFLGGSTESEKDVRIKGFNMYAGKGYPFLTSGSREVTATLVYVKPDEYDDVLGGLDYLEGYLDEGHPNNHYDRVKHTFPDDDGNKVTAWLYVASPHTQSYVEHSLPVLEEGDWIEHAKKEREKQPVKELTFEEWMDE
jgi:gamma-glutamylcyclotransferase (GGCT)/AIG2-like uncharacterized protein YtfP